MSSDKTHKVHVPGWLPRKPGTQAPFRGKFPIKVGVPMTQEMTAFLDVNAEELAHQLGTNVSRNALVRECIARVAWDYFDQDIE